MTTSVSLQELLPEGLTAEEFHHWLEEYQGKDSKEAALKLSNLPSDWRQVITDQLEGRRLSVDKFPALTIFPNFFFPPKKSLEQASSDLAANYKAKLFSGTSCIDLSAGFGHDSRSFARSFQKVISIEKDPHLVAINRFNNQVLGLNHIEVIGSTAEYFLANNKIKHDLIFIDPSRREGSSRVKDFSQAQPDPKVIFTEAKKWSRKVIMKCPPMFDITSLQELLGKVGNIHVVCIKDECKEILMIWSEDDNETTRIHAVELDETWCHEFIFTSDEEKQATLPFDKLGPFAYLPYTAIVKAGAYNSLGKHWEIQKISANTHVYSSNQHLTNFPGQAYEVKAVLPYNASKIKEAFPDSGFIIMKRNFPDSIEQISKKLHIKDYGQFVLLAFRNEEEVPQIAVLRKLD